jgi:linoleoyl-CoA desaturase
VSGWTRRRWEPWRDCLAIAAINHVVLLTAALLHLHGLALLVAGLVLSVGFAMGTVTVLHDAGHRMYASRTWPNVVAVQVSTPAGLWVGHWTLKHRVHHKLSQVYPLDEATRSSSLVRLHPDAPSKPWQRAQHLYAWFAYSLAWIGELRSQVRYLRDGQIAGTKTPDTPARARSFVAEKALWLAVLAPYVWLMGLGRLVLIIVIAETVASLLAALVLVVGHINEGLTPTSEPPGGAQWAAYLVRTTASFSLDSTAMRWFTGGLTHHLAHHLRPVATRSELPLLHDTVVRDLVVQSGVEQSVYATFPQAVRGHYRRLRELGQPGVVAHRNVAPGRESLA